MFFIINTICIFLILGLLIVLSMVWPPDSPWSPWWRTSFKTAQAFCRLAQVTSKDIVYELGSGEGVILITASQAYKAKGVGIEIDPLRVVWSKGLVKRYGLGEKITIKRENFFNTSIKEASVIYVYLVPRVLNKLEMKFKKELKKGTRIVSLRYQIPYLVCVKRDKKNKLFLYKI